MAAQDDPRQYDNERIGILCSQREDSRPRWRTAGFAAVRLPANSGFEKDSRNARQSSA